MLGTLIGWFGMGIMSKNLVKSVSNLRLISKRHYQTAVADRLLVKRFHGSSREDSYYFSALSDEDFSATKKMWLPLFEDFKVVVGSCNGVVCLDNAINESVVWNPSTEEVRIIPSEHMGHYNIFAKEHSFSSGFGFDSISHDLKLIRFITNFGEIGKDGSRLMKPIVESIVELYSVKNDSWKSIGHPKGYFVLRNPCAYINGNNYWLACAREGRRMRDVLSFDFATENFSTFPLPSIGKPLGGVLDFDFVDFEGSLGVVVFPYVGTEKCFELWVWNGGSWSKEVDICVPGAQNPLGFWKKVLFFQGINRQLMVYDMTTEKTNKLDIYDYPHKMQLVPYARTMLSIQELLEMV